MFQFPDRTAARAVLSLASWFIFALSAVASPDRPVFKLAFPGERLVFQRSTLNRATIPLRGSCQWAGSKLQARLLPVAPQVPPGEWTDLGDVSANGDFLKEIIVPAGWYSLEMRAVSGDQVASERVVERIGVGEIFIVIGHSVAQGGELNLPGAKDDRVQTFPLNDPDLRKYERSAELDLLPRLAGSVFGTGIKPAPFGHDTYFWASFAERIVRRDDVPVLLLNAGFGGTSLEHWAKSARGESFEHGFVRSGLRMPYINLYNALEKYARVLGVRAILSDQGQNDWPRLDSNQVFQDYKTVVLQARSDLACPNLAFLINRQTPGAQSAQPSKQIRAVQERIMREIPDCYPGPDYDSFAPEDRPDGIHLGMSGLEKAAQLWADAVSPAFLKNAKPYIPKP